MSTEPNPSSTEPKGEGLPSALERDADQGPSTQEALKELRYAPWRAPALALTSTVFSALILYVNEEVDAYAPLLIGLGIWTLWRSFHGWVSTLITTPWVALASLMIFERSMAHQRFILEISEWAPVSMSLTLLICSGLLAFSIPLRVLDVWFHRA